MSPNLWRSILLVTGMLTYARARLSYNCTYSFVPVHVNSETVVFDLEQPANVSQLTGFLTRYISETSNTSASIMTGTHTLNASYDIFTQLCVPSNFTRNGTLEFAIHGLGFDHTYWSFGGRGSKYNYAEAAIRAGHAIFTYDRLSVGRSSKPNGITEAQRSTEVDVAEALVRHVRNGTGGHTFGNIVGVGHSFGSSQLVGVGEKYGNLFDAMVLTGFTSYGGALPITIASWGLTFARSQNPARFGSLNTSYLVTEGIYNDQLTFFRYRAFDNVVLALAEATKQTLQLGEILTTGAAPAPNYTNPVFVVTGAKDFIYCGGNCYQSVNGSANLVEGAMELFPSSSNFSTYIPPETGHAVNLHYSAPQTFEVIEQWINGTVS